MAGGNDVMRILHREFPCIFKACVVPRVSDAGQMTSWQVRVAAGRISRFAAWCAPCSRFRLGEVRHDVLPAQRKSRGGITGAFYAAAILAISPERAWTGSPSSVIGVAG